VLPLILTNTALLRRPLSSGGLPHAALKGGVGEPAGAVAAVLVYSVDEPFAEVR